MALRAPPLALGPDDLVDTEFETASDLRHLKSEFNIQEGLQLIFTKEGRGPITVGEGCAIRNWISHESLTEPAVSGVNSPFSLREARAEINPRTGAKRIWFARLLDPDCEKGESAVPLDLGPVLASPWGGTVVNRAGTDLSVNFSYDSAFHASTIASVLARVRNDLLPKLPDFDLQIGGLHAFRYYVQSGMQGMLGVNLLALVLLSILIRLFLGRWLGFWIFLGTLVLTFATIWIGMAFLAVPIDLVNSNLFLMILIATLEDFVYLSYLQLKGVPSESCFRRMIRPSFFTSFTTWIGFTSLAFSNLAIVRQFGIPAGAAAMVEWGVVFFILPAAIRAFPGLSHWVRPERAILSGRIAALSTKRIPRKLAFFLLLAIPGAIAIAPFLTYREEPARVFAAGHPIRRSSEYYSRTRDSNASGELVFAHLENEERNREVIARFREIPGVTRVEDPYETERYILRNLPPFERTEFVSTLRSVADVATWISSTGQVKGHFDVRDPDIAAMNRVRARVRELCPVRECWIAGTFVSYAEFGEKVRQTLISSLLLSLIFVGLVIGGVAWRRGFRRELPLLVATAMWGPALCCLIVGAFSIPVSVVSCLFAATLTGLTGDNTIQFLFVDSPPGKAGLADATESLGGASVFLAFTMILLALVFLLSPFATARVLGSLLALGFGATLIGDLWLLRGLLPAKGGDA